MEPKRSEGIRRRSNIIVSRPALYLAVTIFNFFFPLIIITDTCFQVPLSAFKYDRGHPKIYKHDTGVTREFCDNCGTFICEYGVRTKRAPALCMKWRQWTAEANIKSLPSPQLLGSGI